MGRGKVAAGMEFTAKMRGLTSYVKSEVPGALSCCPNSGGTGSRRDRKVIGGDNLGIRGWESKRDG